MTHALLSQNKEEEEEEEKEEEEELITFEEGAIQTECILVLVQVLM